MDNKIWNKKRTFWIFVCFLLIVGILFVAFSRFILQSISQSPKSPPPPIITQKEIAQKNLENILAKWIYEHSDKISINSAIIITKESLKTNKPLLMLALIEVESNFIPTAISTKGAIGLTQVMFDIHGKNLIKKGIIKEKRDLLDLIPSIRAGDFVLDDCLVQSKGNVPKALERYLGGKDGAYLHRILSNLANLYILVSSLETI